MNPNNEVKVTSASATPVLIVGGSLVGLSAAMFLAWRGVPVVLVEKHAGSSPHPRAIGYTSRTMELFRAVEVSQNIPTTPQGGLSKPRRIRVDSLAGQWHEEAHWTPKTASPNVAPPAPIEHSPCTTAGIAQDKLEPMLRKRAIELGAEIRMSTTLLSFEQDDDGVTAMLREEEGKITALRANYMITADGNRSPIREALGIERAGKGLLRTLRSVLFRASFSPALGARLDEAMATGVRQFTIDEPDLKVMCGTYGDGRWLVMFEDDVERDAEELKAAVRRVVGEADLEIEILAQGRWDIAGMIADRFAAGRVFLAGDAAHMLPPNRGGYGANTGIEDAHNLAWKLGAVLDGTSDSALLDSYDAERRPIAWLRHDQIFARPEHAIYAGPAEDTAIIEDDAMEWGQLYRSSAVIGAAENLPPALRPDQWQGQPGTRAPHLWVTRDGERKSTLDLFGRGWVLVAQGDWAEATAQTSHALGIELEYLRVGLDIVPADEAAFATAFGLGTTGAALIRPDGFVAWRSPDLPADPAGALTKALSLVASAARQMALADRTDVLRTRQRGHASNPTKEENLKPNTAALEARIQKLEDIAAIENLMARYAFYTNKGWNGQVLDVEAMPSIFTNDIHFISHDAEELSAIGIEQGLKVLRQTTEQIEFSMHSFTNPIIAVEGDRATGNWLVWIVAKAQGTIRQVFCSEDVIYARTAQGWRIQTVNFHVGTALFSQPH